MKQSSSWESLVICQLVKKFPAFNGTRRYYRFDKSSPLFWDKNIWPSPSRPVTLRSNLYPIWAYVFRSTPPFRYSNQNPVLTCLSSQSCHNPHPFNHPNNIWPAGVLNLFTIQFSDASFSHPDAFLSTFLWNTFSLFPSLNARHRVHTRTITHMNVTTLMIVLGPWNIIFGLM